MLVPPIRGQGLVDRRESIWTEYSLLRLINAPCEGKDIQKAKSGPVTTLAFFSVAFNLTISL